MCEKFGTLSQMVLPSTRTIAIAEFLESNEARRAFQGLAYKRYRHVPLYVEWAPKDIFKTSKKNEFGDDDDEVMIEQQSSTKKPLIKTMSRRIRKKSLKFSS